MTTTGDHAHHIEPRPGARASLEEALHREGVQPIRSADDLACEASSKPTRNWTSSCSSPTPHGAPTSRDLRTSRTRHRRELLARWLVDKHVLHSDDDVARTWGAITAYAYLRGRPRPTNDTWIAACCLAYDLPLATRNVKTSRSTKVCASSVASERSVIGCGAKSVMGLLASPWWVGSGGCGLGAGR